MNVVAAVGIAAGLLAATPATVANAAPAAASELPTGLFQLDSTNGPILSLEAAADTNGDLHAVVRLGKDGSFSLNGGVVPKSQKLFALSAGGGAYYICSDGVVPPGVFALSCLDVTGESKQAGARIKLAPFSGQPSQRWRVRNNDPVRPRTRTVQNVNSGLYLDTGATPTAGSAIVQRPFNNDFRQRWIVEPA
jgi:hypothetical protein